ncbi:MAG: DUF58 domain-containing protein [Planctomycetota bacterium]
MRASCRFGTSTCRGAGATSRGGLRLISNIGESEEFIGNREYHPGDRMRNIHHASWARLGFPVVREFQEEYLCRIALVVDTYLPRLFRRRSSDFEAAVSLSAAVAEILSRREHVVDLFAAGPVIYYFQAGRSLAYLDDILDVLACIEACTDDPFDRLAPLIAEKLGQISIVIFVLLDWDEPRERFVRSIRDLGVEVKVLVVHEGAPTYDTRSSSLGPIKLLTPKEIARGVDVL